MGTERTGIDGTFPDYEGYGGLTYTGEFIIGRPIVYTEFVIGGSGLGYTVNLLNSQAMVFEKSYGWPNDIEDSILITGGEHGI